ncbi:MAG: alanine--tRNA ligase-related protein [Oscillospiraceae bacterium]
MTERLYYADSKMKRFTAAVTSCEAVKDGYAVTLDRTAFFPEGGGQAGDSGFIGQARVSDTQEKNGETIHYVNQPLTVGEVYDCAIDWEIRFRRMQNHSGEHIVSGLVHKKYGYNNIGFHMGNDFVTIDFDGELTWEQLAELEREANLAVAENHKICTSFPPEEVLEKLQYRSKLELTENVRIVEIEGVDICACCAPHLASTAEVGMIKILDSERRRRGGEGVRISMLCGLDAYENAVVTQNNNTEISMLLSAKRNETAAAVRRVMKEQEKLKARVSELSRELAACRAAAITPTEGNICIFDSTLDEPALRALINEAVKKCGGVAAVFSGSDDTGFRYIIGSRSVDLKSAAKVINEGISGRGGGSPNMIQGNCTACTETIQKFLNSFTV